MVALPELFAQTHGPLAGHGAVVTLAAAFAAGGILIILARRLRLPAIVLLLSGGILLGPEFLNWVQPAQLGPFLSTLVSLGIGLILFEGGLTLDVSAYRRAKGVIPRLLTLGALISWASVSTIVYFLFEVELAFALLAGSLVVVTGPTVIQPLLKRIRLRNQLHTILHWESVLIDPVGVFIAVLVFEWVAVGVGEEALYNLFLRVAGGLFIGFVGGQILGRIPRSRLVPEDLINVFMISGAVLIFGLTEAIIREGGLLAVTVAGLTVGVLRPPALRAIKEFKATITDLLIGFLFVILASRLELSQFVAFGERGIYAVLLVMLVARPLTVLACTYRQGLGWREKLFLSWVAPRGIVAASMASFFAISLAESGRFPNPEFLEIFVYSVICATVVLQGFSAGAVARLLRLQEPEPDGWLIVGAHPFARHIAHFLREVRKVPVTLIDHNRHSVEEARAEGLATLQTDARDTLAVTDMPDARGLGRLLALTDNEDLNELLCEKWGPLFGSENVYRWAAQVKEVDDTHGRVLFGGLPKPAVINAEMQLQTVSVVRHPGQLSLKAAKNAIPLLMGNAREVIFEPKATERLKNDKLESATLYLLQTPQAPRLPGESATEAAP